MKLPEKFVKELYDEVPLSIKFSLDEIIVVCVNNLKENGYNISKISNLMYIPITELSKIMIFLNS